MPSGKSGDWNCPTCGDLVLLAQLRQQLHLVQHRCKLFCTLQAIPASGSPAEDRLSRLSVDLAMISVSHDTVSAGTRPLSEMWRQQARNHLFPGGWQRLGLSPMWRSCVRRPVSGEFSVWARLDTEIRFGSRRSCRKCGAERLVTAKPTVQMHTGDWRCPK